jgi:hypothetical protein
MASNPCSANPPWMVLIGGLLLVAGCGVLEPEADVCPVAAGEFPFFGCADVTADIQAPPQPWPPSYRWSFTVVPARESAGFGPRAAVNPGPGSFTLRIGQYERPHPGDTVSVWVIGKLLEDPRPIQSGVPLPVFAADSALVLLQFSEPGERVIEHTVELRLVRPDE